MTPIHIPSDWDDNDLLSFQEFCQLMHLAQRTVRDWRRRGAGPQWLRIKGTGRLYIRVGDVRRMLSAATARPLRGDAS